LEVDFIRPNNVRGRSKRVWSLNLMGDRPNVNNVSKWRYYIETRN